MTDEDRLNYPILNTVEDFIDEGARELIDIYRLEIADIPQFYTSLVNQTGVNLSESGRIEQIVNGTLSVDSSNWKACCKMLASASVIGLELAARGPFRIYVGTTLLEKDNVFGIDEVEHYAHCDDKIMETLSAEIEPLRELIESTGVSTNELMADMAKLVYIEMARQYIQQLKRVHQQFAKPEDVFST